MPSSPGPVGSTGMAFRMTIGHPRPWPGYPRHTGLISATAVNSPTVSCSSYPRFRHQLSSDPASRRAPLPRRMVPVITVHGGLTPLECTSLLDTPGESPVPPCCDAVRGDRRFACPRLPFTSYPTQPPLAPPVWEHPEQADIRPRPDFSQHAPPAQGNPHAPCSAPRPNAADPDSSHARP